MFNIIFYELPGGRVPVQAWLDELAIGGRDDKSLLRKIRGKINLLQALGRQLDRPHAVHLTKGRNVEHQIWELRIDRFRILYSPYENNFVLLHWANKKTRKVPPREIDIALKRMSDWVRLQKGGIPY